MYKIEKSQVNNSGNPNKMARCSFFEELDEDVALTGFGTFKVVKRKARKGRNPYTGEEIKIKATKAPKFTLGKALKEAVK